MNIKNVQMKGPRIHISCICCRRKETKEISWEFRFGFPHVVGLKFKLFTRSSAD